MVPRRRILSRSRSPQRVPREPEEQRRYRKEEFMQMLNNNKCMIVVGEHGSSTTTEIPKWCHEWTQKHPRNTDRYPGMVACTQPNGYDAIAAAAKTADEVRASLGEEVGYAVRFERRSSNKTTLKFSTDDVLLREIMNNRSLEGYDVIIVDKVEERSLNTDILMALLKDMIKNRLDIKLVIISTKLEAGKFQNYFDNCPAISVAMKEQTPQIYRINIANILLQLKKMGLRTW